MMKDACHIYIERERDNVVRDDREFVTIYIERDNVVYWNTKGKIKMMSNDERCMSHIYIER